ALLADQSFKDIGVGRLQRRTIVGHGMLASSLVRVQIMQADCPGARRRTPPSRFPVEIPTLNTPVAKRRLAAVGERSGLSSHPKSRARAPRPAAVLRRV